jgi:putative endonuclease
MQTKFLKPTPINLMNNQSFGKKGEDLATEFLIEEGYDILERNWRFKHIEIDIIARNKHLLIIAEVKTRSGNSYGEPSTAVDIRKQRALIVAAEHYVYAHNLDLDVRFDIISIIIGNGRTALEHIKEAFHPIAR